MSTPESGTPSPRPSPPAGRTRRWLVPLLVVSVAFNLVVIGVALAGQIWQDHARSGDHRSMHLLPRQFFHELDRDRRGELREVFRTRKDEYRAERRALGEAASAFADALEAEPFDLAQAQSAITEHASRTHRLVDLGAAAAGDIVATLTAEERRALAEAIRHRLEQARQRRERRSP